MNFVFSSCFDVGRRSGSFYRIVEMNCLNYGLRHWNFGNYTLWVTYINHISTIRPRSLGYFKLKGDLPITNSYVNTPTAQRSTF